MGLRKWMPAVAMLVLAGCGGVTNLQAPELDVVDVKLLGGDLSGQQLRVRMRVTNPNDRELPVRGITYRMDVGGEQFATGESERDFVVPALGTTEFDMSVNADMAGAIFRLLGSGKKLDVVDYRLTGKVSLSSGMLRTIPFDEKGSFKLR